MMILMPALIPIIILITFRACIHPGAGGRGPISPGEVPHLWQNIEFGQLNPKISAEKTKITMNIGMWMTMLTRAGI